MHNGPYVTVTECAPRRRYVGKFHLSCSECGLLSSHARPVAPPPVTSANVIKTCIASRLLSLHVRPVGFVCLFFNRKQTSTVNASVGHCMKDRWPPPLVRSQFRKELAVDVVRYPAQWGLFVQLSQCKCRRMLSAPNSTKNLQWMWVAITSYTIQALSPLCQFFN